MGRWVPGAHPPRAWVGQEGPEVQPSHAQPEAPDPADRLLTVPNVLSLLRLAGVPLFLWLLLGPHYDLLAMLVLALAGLTDWLDGKLARLLNQSSRLGALLDPAVATPAAPWLVLTAVPAVSAVIIGLLARRGSLASC